MRAPATGAFSGGASDAVVRHGRPYRPPLRTRLPGACGETLGLSSGPGRRWRGPPGFGWCRNAASGPPADRVRGLAEQRGFTLREAPVFCTDSIACEYAHLDFIKSFGVQLIEMETSSFYLLADLMEKPAVALLAVSDNSATGNPLVGRTEAQKRPYDQTRKQVIPQLILDIAAL